MDEPLEVVDALIRHVRADRTIGVTAVERVTGATLRETDRSNASFAFYEADGVRSGASTMSIDLRTPRAGSGATSGPLLVLDLAGACPLRADVETRYGPLTLKQVPRGDAADEEAHWSRQEAWGELSFGFPARDPNCLSSVVFTVAR